MYEQYKKHTILCYKIELTASHQNTIYKKMQTDENNSVSHQNKKSNSNVLEKGQKVQFLYFS